MKAIFLCQSTDKIFRVYDEQTRSALRELTGIEKTVYSKEDILNDPSSFQDVEWIFSTWGMPVLTEDEIRCCLPNLKCLFYGAGTVKKFARPFLNCGVKVFSAWAANAVPVAEYTVAQIILANKGFFKTMRYTDRTVARKEAGQFPGNYDVKIGIIGAGMIGKLVIRKLKDYNLEVLVFDPFLPDATAQELGVKKVSLETLFAQCQVVSNHLANNKQTEGMLNGALFAAMLPYATFLNTGRGAQVVEPDLISVLKERPDLMAILDVTEPEPPEKDSALYTLENCILTPHLAGSYGNEVRRMGEYMETEYQNFIQNRPCKYEVTLQMLETMA